MQNETKKQNESARKTAEPILTEEQAEKVNGGNKVTIVGSTVTKNQQIGYEGEFASDKQVRVSESSFSVLVGKCSDWNK